MRLRGDGRRPTGLVATAAGLAAGALAAGALAAGALAAGALAAAAPAATPGAAVVVRDPVDTAGNTPLHLAAANNRRGIRGVHRLFER